MPGLFALPVSANHPGPRRHNGRNVAPGFHVIDVGRLAPQSFLRRKRRPWARSACNAFERSDQRRLLAANKGARSLHQLDIEVESATENVRAQQSVLPRLLDGPAQPSHRQRILGAHIDDALRCAHGVGADDHPLEQRMGIALNLVAVHVSAGIALIGIADDVLFIRLRLGKEVPLVAGQKPGSAASAQPGRLDLLDHRFRRAHRCNTLYRA